MRLKTLNITIILNIMAQVILEVEENRYALLLQFLQTLDYVRIRPLYPHNSAQPPIITGKKYDFSDLSGKLKWAGNGLTEQQNLRNEW